MEKLELIKTILTIIISFCSVCGTVYVFFKKIIAKQTESIVSQINKKLDDLKNTTDIVEEKVESLEKKLFNTIEQIGELQQRNKKGEKVLILDVKCDILNICRRANKYKGITLADKEVLCELYEQYVNVWHKNHFIKSEADFVINNLPTIDRYEDAC